MIMTPKKKRNKRDIILTTAHRNYEKGMSSYALFKVQNNAMSKDLVQDTFIKTWKYLVKNGKINLMKPFLYHILNQLIIDEYRKKYRKNKTTSLDALIEKGFEPGFDNSERIINTLDGKAILLLIKYLPTKYEKVVRMRYVQNLSLKEISLITGQSRNAVAVQAYRGLEKLKKLYKQK